MEREEGGRLRRRAATLGSPLRISAFRRLWMADVISLLGDWAGRLALAVIVEQRTGSPAWTAAVTAVSLAGFVGIGQVLATFADRFGRVPVMLVADVVRAALFFGMLLDVPVTVILVLAFLAGMASPPFEAARSAAIPDVVPPERYGDALALAGISVQASVVAGNALGGVLLFLVGAHTALAINALSYLVSAWLLLDLRRTPAGARSAVTATVGASLRDGAREIFGDRLIRRGLAIISITGALGTVGEALVVPYAGDIGLSEGGLGLLAASIPVGTILATLLIGTGGAHRVLLRAASVCALVVSVAAAPLFWLGAEGWMAFLAFMIAGGLFAISIPTNVVIGTRLRRETRASAMGIAVGVLMGSQAIGAAVGGVVASTFGPGEAIGGAFGLTAAFAVFWLVTNPYEARHLARGRREVVAPVVVDLRDEEGGVVLDLVALESQAPTPQGPPSSYVVSGSIAL